MIMVELLWKSTVVCAVFEYQYVKSEVFKPNCKVVYQLSLQNERLCYVNKSRETNYHYHLLLMMERMQ